MTPYRATTEQAKIEELARRGNRHRSRPAGHPLPTFRRTTRMASSKTSGNADKTPPYTLATPPPSHADHVILSFPSPHIMLVTFNRPKAMNAVDIAMRLDLESIFNWFETEPDLWVAVVTGNGPAFSAGADLKA